MRFYTNLDYKSILFSIHDFYKIRIFVLLLAYSSYSIAVISKRNFLLQELCFCIRFLNKGIYIFIQYFRKAGHQE